MNRTGSKILHGMLLATSAMVGSTMIVSTAAMANPAGGSVAIGAATITNPSATQTVINQSSKKALINWNSFNVATGASVTFNQPNAKSLTVNRVTGPGSSTINGSLFANGNIWLLNANGILFGKGSQINVGSIMATTSELSDADFKAGNNNFTASPNSNASVINQGTITASRGGSVVLSAPLVSNEGLIQADLGTVVLGGAQAFTVDMTGDNLLRYEIAAPVSQAPKDADGKTATALVSNSGTISAAGGHVVMTARAAKNVEDSVINNTGMVEANSVSVHDGEVDIDAGDGTANVGGTVDVSGNGAGQTGGTVTATGGTVTVADGAKINASGTAGGGTVMIGGGPHGTGTLAHAQRTVIGAATITADATQNGNGGNVTVWSDGTTTFNGTISARGGATGGNGGQVETSGHNLGVAPTAKVDTSAPLGLAGDWLLDPTTVDISNTGTSSGQTEVISAAALQSNLGSGDVTLEATGGSAAEINVNSSVGYSSSNTLNLLSTGNITFNAGIQNSSNGDINVIAGWNGTAGAGHFTDSGAYGNNSGSVTLSGTGSVGSFGGTTTFAGNNINVGTGFGGTEQIGYRASSGGGGNINVVAANGITLSGSNNGLAVIGNGLAACGTGAITGNLSIVAGGTLDLVPSTGTTIIGNGEYQNGASVSGAVSGDIAINVGALTIAAGNMTIGNTGGTSTAGNVTIITDTYSETGTEIETDIATDLSYGDVSFNATGVSVTLDDINATGSHNLTIAAAGDFTANGNITSSGAISLSSGGTGSGDLTLNGAVTASSLTLFANGTISQNSTGLSVGALTANAFGDITLTSGSNAISGGVTLGSTAGNVAFTNGETTLLNGVSAAGTFDIEVTNANQGSGDAQLILHGTTTGGAGQSTLHAAGDIVNDLLVNPFAPEHDNPNNGTSYNPNSVDTTITADALNLISDDGSVPGALPNGGTTYFLGFSVNSLHVSTGASGGVALSGDNTFSIGIAGDGTGLNVGTGGGYVGAAVGDMTQLSGDDGKIISTGDIQFGATGTYALNNTENDVSGNLTLYSHTGGSVSFTNHGATSLANISSDLFDTAIVGGNVTLSVIDGPVTQTGALYATNLAINLSTDDDSSPPITLTNPANDITGTFSVTAPGDVAFTNSGAITLGDINDGTEMVGACGSSPAHNVTYPAGNISITSINGGIDEVGVLDGSNITLTAHGDITQGADGEMGGVSLNATSTAGNVMLTGGNVFDVASLSAAGNATLYNYNSGDILALTDSNVTGNLTVLTTGELDVIGQVQDSNGWVLGVAGWDGNASINTAALIAADNDYGANGSDIYIGDSAGGLNGSSFGGANGTTVFGYDVNVISNVTSAQLGYVGGTGDISVNALGDVNVIADDTCDSFCTAVIGNGEQSLTSAVSGNITIAAGGDVDVLTGSMDDEGEGGSYGIAQIGNQGAGATVGGTINITAAGGIVLETFESGPIQIGNSGYGNATAVSGDISVTANGSTQSLFDQDEDAGISIGGEGDVQIGNYSAGTSVGGNITVTANTSTIAIFDLGAFVQIGNYGNNANGAVGGNINVNALGGDLALDTIAFDDAATMIGNSGTGMIGGDIAVNVTGNLNITTGGEGGQAISQIGNGLSGNSGTVSGNVTVTTSGSVSLYGEGGGAALIGNGNPYEVANIGGNIAVHAGTDISLYAEDGNAVIGNVGMGDTVNGTINVTAAGNVSLESDTDGSTQIGNSGNNENITVSGDVFVTANGTGGISILVDDGGDSAQIGNLALQDGSTVGGNITVVANDGDINLTGSGEYAQIGNFAIGSIDPDLSGEIAVTATEGNIILDSKGENSVVRIGQTGHAGGGTMAGNITVTASGDLSLMAETNGSIAQIGNGGIFDDGPVTGNINVTAGGNITISATAGNDDDNDDEDEEPSPSYAMIGNGDPIGMSSGNVSGDIRIQAGGTIFVDSYSDVNDGGDNDLAWIGNIGGSDTGDIETGNVTIQAGTVTDMDDASFGDIITADLGSSTTGSGGNVFVGVNTAPNIGGLSYDSGNTLSIATEGNLNITDSIQNAGAGGLKLIAGWDGTTFTPSLLGQPNGATYGNNHGDVNIGGEGLVAVGSAHGSTTVAGANVTLNSGESASQIGYNGGGATGDIVVSATGNITLNALQAYAQIGHGGDSTNGSDSGNVTVTAGGAVNLIGGSAGFNEYAQIGHGGNNANNDPANSFAYTGNVDVTGASVNLIGGGDSSGGYAQIGHGGQSVGDDPSAAITETLSGDINVTATAGSVSLLAGAGNADAQIGHGGAYDGIVFSNEAGIAPASSYSGNITVKATGGSVILTADGADQDQSDFAMIGHGGVATSGNDIGDISVTSDHDITLTAGNGQPDGFGLQFAQIGNGGDKDGAGTDSGNITLNAAGNLTLQGSTGYSDDSDYVQIGNGSVLFRTSTGTGPSTGNISINVGGTLTIASTDGASDVWIGNIAGTDGNAGGAVSIIAGNIAGDDDNNDDSEQFLLADLQNGDLTLGVTGPGADEELGGLDYSSSHALTLLSTGDLNVVGDIQNSGTGNVTLVAGWNATVAPDAVVTTTGAYGNNNATLTIGGADASGGASVGSAGGTTSVLTDNLTIEAAQGTAQLGYAGASNGTVNVSALGNVTLATLGGGTATIGGSTDTGAINILAAGLTASGASTIAGNSADIQLTGTGNSLGTSANPLVVAVNNLALGTHSGDAYISSPIRGFSIDVGSDGINLGSGNLTLTANGTISQMDAPFINVNNLFITVTNGNIALANSGNTIKQATISSSGDAFVASSSNLTIAGASVGGNLTLDTGNLSQTGAIQTDELFLAVNSATLNNAGNVFDKIWINSTDDVSAKSAAAITVDFIDDVSGNVTLNAASVSSGGMIFASSLTVNASNGDIELNNAQNVIASATLNASGDASLTDSTALIVNGANVGGTLTLTSGGSIGQSGAINANTLAATASNGDIVLTNAGNAITNATLTASGNASLYDGSSLTLDGAATGGNLALLTKGDLTIAGSAQSNSGAILAVAGWDGTTTGAAAANGSAYGNNGGSITVGGSGATGGVAIGSRTGTTTLAANNLLLSAVNGYAQVGYHGGGSGAILVNATGNVTLNGGTGTAYFAQIGDGGYQVSGNNSDAISVLANGNVTLNAGSGQEAYAQIGNGGAESNSNSSGYTNTGAITVHGKTVALKAGGGNASYAQIGDGGYKSGQSLNGVATVGGGIEIDAVTAVSLNGNASDAYAQVGNGGDFINSNAANGSSGTTSGNILVAVASPAVKGNAVSATAGSGTNSYAQIGNGGDFENTPATTNTGKFTVSGNITLNDLGLTGSNTGANGYAQVGNGDGAGTGTGNVSGDIEISKGTVFVITPGTAPGTSAGIQNATGNGTASGTVSGYNGGTPPTQPTSDPTTAGSVSSIIQNSNSPTSYIYTASFLAPEFSYLEDLIGPKLDEPTPLEKLAGNDDDVPSDDVANSVSGSLDGGKARTTSRTIIPGVLEEIVTLTPRNPHGIPPADEDYSSWGNEAFWRW